MNDETLHPMTEAPTVDAVYPVKFRGDTRPHFSRWAMGEWRGCSDDIQIARRASFPVYNIRALDGWINEPQFIEGAAKLVHDEDGDYIEHPPKRIARPDPIDPNAGMIQRDARNVMRKAVEQPGVPVMVPSDLTERIKKAVPGLLVSWSGARWLV